MGNITLICGSIYSDRSKQLDALWEKYGESAVLLTPTRRLARVRQEAYVRDNNLPGLWGNRAWELSAFASVLLEGAGIPVRMVSRLDRRIIVRRVLEQVIGDDSLPRYDITPGLVKHLLQIITQLKQAGVEPAQFRRAASGNTESSDNDSLVAAVYDGYQDALLEGRLYDVPGLYWEAEQYCRQVNVCMPGDASTVLLDGFDDFTPSQQRFLESLSRHVSRLVIGINYDVDPDRSDLFHLQRHWVENFQRNADVEILTCHSYSPETAVHYAAARIFGRNARVVPRSLVSNLRIIPCADAQHEIEYIGRSVKDLILHQQVAPSAIAVALADMPESAGMLRSIFQGFGIPCKLREMPALFNAAVAAVLMRLFELFGTWEIRNLVALATSPLIQTAPEQREAVMAFPLIARETGVLMGRQAWMNAIEGLQQRLEHNGKEEHTGSFPSACTSEAIALFKERLEMFADFEDQLPAEASPAEYARLCALFVKTLGMAVAAGGNETHLAAVNALQGLLQSFATEDMANASCGLDDFTGLLREGMQETDVFVENQPGGGVFCTGIDGLRCEHFTHVFLGGLNESVFPCPAPQNALYAEIDLSRLQRQGVVLAGRREHTYRQRMLFSHVLHAAQKTLTLSWRKQDKSGRESLPSPYVVELMDIFEGVENIVHSDPGPDCFVPDAASVASPRDLANTVYYRGVTVAETEFQELLAPVKELAAIERQRNGPDPFSIYDGVIQAPDLQEWLAKTFDSKAQFSVGALEAYIEFPFNFFLDRVLCIRKTEVPEGELEPMLRGSLLHEVLQRFHKHYKGKTVPEILEEDSEEARKFMDETISAVFHEHDYQMRTIPGPIIGVEERRFALALHRYLKRELRRPTGFRPCHFEVSFGYVFHKSRDEIARTEPFIMQIDNQDIRFSGIIDRIDFHEGEACIVDYKTANTPSKKELTSGLSLQLTLYAWAVEHYLLAGCPVASAFYLPVLKGKSREALLKNKPEEEANRVAAAKFRIANAVKGIRTGYFPPLPDEDVNTRNYSFPTAARYEGWRILRKFPKRGGTDALEDNHAE